LIPVYSSRLPALHLAPLSIIYTPLALSIPTFPKPLPLLSLLSFRVSIDVNAVQKTRLLSPHNCYCCREMDYLVKDCLYRLDIQQLIVEQKKKLIKDLIALKDMIMTEGIEPLSKEDFA